MRRGKARGDENNKRAKAPEVAQGHFPRKLPPKHSRRACDTSAAPGTIPTRTAKAKPAPPSRSHKSALRLQRRNTFEAFEIFRIDVSNAHTHYEMQLKAYLQAIRSHHHFNPPCTHGDTATARMTSTPPEYNTNHREGGVAMLYIRIYYGDMTTRELSRKIDGSTSGPISAPRITLGC